MKKYNNFELLLTAAAEECCEQEATDFLSIDAANFEITRSEEKRIWHMINKNTGSKTSWKVIKIAVVACLVFLAIGFTACMCIPEIRNAIKEVIIEWHEGYIAIGFEEETLEESRQETVEPTPPKTIESKAYASYLPKSYELEIDMDNKFMYIVSFYYESELAFSLTQTPISDENVWVNSENAKIYNVKINEYNAIMIEFLEYPQWYCAVWQDRYYEYEITGSFSSMDELIKVAEGIKTCQ